MPQKLIIEWENAPGTLFEDSDGFAGHIEKLLEPLGYDFCLLGYDSDGRYNTMTGYREES
jgi:hypothetical protein